MFDCASASKAGDDGATQPRASDIALSVLPAGVSVFDAEERLVFTNQAFRTLYGLGEQNLRAGMTSRLVLQAIGVPQSHLLGKTIHSPSMAPRVLKSVRGETIRITAQSLPDGGWLEMHVVEQREVPALGDQKIEDELEQLPQEMAKQRFLAALDAQLCSGMAGEIVAVHAFKVDGIDAIHRDHGVTSAIMLQRLVGKRLQGSLRQGDRVVELGDARYAVLQTGLEDACQAEALSQRLLATLNAPYRVAASLLRVSVRSGIAIVPQDARDAATAFEKAEIALLSLQPGAERHQLYSQIEPAHFDRDQMARELAAALDAGDLKIYYQPIIDIHRLEVAGFEALMRWQHPSRGFIPASEFIAVAEETGQITKLGTWAVETACRDAATWNGPYRVSVNFSGQQFGLENPLPAVRHALDVSGLDPKRLEIEVTETALLQNAETVNRQLLELQTLGVKIALDDFGAAYATLATLRDFHFDKIKIDRSFIGDVQDRKNCSAIVRAVAGLADALDIRSVAEGVETMDQLREVRASGYSEIQGFYFSMAVPAEQIPQTLKDCEEKLAWLRG